jgi:hypothetical protein
VEDRDKIQPDDDVEAHKSTKHIKATDEGGESDSDDFELHKKRGANDEGTDDDDFELHKQTKHVK